MGGYEVSIPVGTEPIVEYHSLSVLDLTRADSAGTVPGG